MTTISTTGPQTNPAAKSELPGLTTDYTMFLKLLTTQMQYQDPLDPMDTSEYTQQLVQYSQVEQAIKQTGSLNDIVSQLSGQQLSQASAFIGREARFDTPVAGLGGGESASWTYQLPGMPKSLVANITDAAGKTVHSVTLDPAAQGKFEWDGKLASGSKAPDGAYTLSLTVDGGGTDAPTATVNSVATVKDVVKTGTEVMLGVNGIRMPYSSLVALSSGE